MLEHSVSLVLSYKPGQFTFRHFNPAASETQLHDLALLLNAFQTCKVDKILKVRVYEF
jgi:hypothetical protein